MSWEPALKTLVSSIGAKFSAAFDRMIAFLEYPRLFHLWVILRNRLCRRDSDRPSRRRLRTMGN